mmetsp:Transcript_7196/g.14792  ORF Transcript_7196/g.14792 Transcript_7196/m.14792 type:complete len:122 (-) Transcript_7196:1599-1964(-)
MPKLERPYQAKVVQTQIQLCVKAKVLEMEIIPSATILPSSENARRLKSLTIQSIPGHQSSHALDQSVYHTELGIRLIGNDPCLSCSNRRPPMQCSILVITLYLRSLEVLVLLELAFWLNTF